MQMHPHALIPRDAKAVEGHNLERETLRRVWVFAQPYRATITVFLGAILASALVALVPPSRRVTWTFSVESGSKAAPVEVELPLDC